MILACGSSITGAVDSFFADLAIIAIPAPFSFGSTLCVGVFCYKAFDATLRALPGDLLLVVSLPDCFGGAGSYLHYVLIIYTLSPLSTLSLLHPRCVYNAPKRNGRCKWRDSRS